MTEEEAKAKWCPFVRYTGGTETGHAFDNREQPLGSPAARCIASACMAWRWAGYRAEDGRWVRKTVDGPWDPAKADGFCGLAGQPQ